MKFIKVYYELIININTLYFTHIVQKYSIGVKPQDGK